MRYHETWSDAARIELLRYRRSDSTASFTIRFPQSFDTHCRVQTFYFNRDKLLHRHDYCAEVAGPFVYGAHFTEGYCEHQSLQSACVRKVRASLGSLVLPMNGIYGEVDF
jgi:hypothetical protein